MAGAIPEGVHTRLGGTNAFRQQTQEVKKQADAPQGRENRRGIPGTVPRLQRPADLFGCETGRWRLALRGVPLVRRPLEGIIL